MALYDPDQEPKPQPIRLPAKAYLTEHFPVTRDEASRLCIACTKIAGGSTIDFDIMRAGYAQHVSLFSETGERADWPVPKQVVEPGWIFRVSWAK